MKNQICSVLMIESEMLSQQAGRHILSDNPKAGYYLAGEVIDDTLSGKEKAIWHSETNDYEVI